jgi:hypothetical protein
MSDVEELLDEAYDLVAKILERAGDALNADAEVADAQQIIRETAICLEDIEAYALLAGGPGREAETAIERLLVRLRELNDSLELDQEP